MTNTHKDDRTDNPSSAGGTQRRPPDGEGLTCNEEQVEDLLSQGESTEDDGDEEEATSRPLLQDPPAAP